MTAPADYHDRLNTDLLARWDYADDGLLDRTHLRFFTQPTMVALFAQAGWEVQACTARVFDPEAFVDALLPASLGQ